MSWMTIEVDPSGRAKCKRCQEKVAKGDFRLGVVEYVVLFAPAVSPSTVARRLPAAS